jgi:hypothetical protein
MQSRDEQDGLTRCANRDVRPTANRPRSEGDFHQPFADAHCIEVGQSPNDIMQVGSANDEREPVDVAPNRNRQKQDGDGGETADRQPSHHAVHTRNDSRMGEERLERLVGVQPPDRIGDERCHVDDLEVDR